MNEEQVLLKILLLVIISALVALLGKNRKIGYGWSFVLCLLVSPVIGLIIILFSKKVDSYNFIDVEKDDD